MTAATPTAPALLTADEFIRLHGDESGKELVNGHIVELPMPGPEHGEVCGNAYHYIREVAKRDKLGRVFTNDTFIRTKADACRGADVCFISYAKLPADRPTPRGTFEVAPELVVEVRSPSNTVLELSDKASEYLRAGVIVVLVIDPDSASVGVFRENELPHRLHNGDVLELPDVLPGFSVPVARFFE